MKHFIYSIALALLLWSDPARAATGLSSPVLTNFNANYFKVSPNAAPTNVVKLNIDTNTIVIGIGGEVTVNTNNLQQVIVLPGDPVAPGGTFPTAGFVLDCSTIWIWDPASVSWTEMNLAANFTAPTASDLRSHPTLICAPLEAHTFGNLVVGDDQASWYRWNPDDLRSDNGMSVIEPVDRGYNIADPPSSDLSTPGRWNQVVFN